MWREWRGRQDAPAAVFLHGWPMDHRDEAATFDAAFAQAGYARLYCDLPGMGQSAGIAVPHDLDGYVSAIQRLIAAELPGRAFVLCGTSAGAYLARGLAARMEGRVRGLILRVPLVEPDDDRRDREPAICLHPAKAPVDQTGLDGPALVEDPRWIAALTAKLDATVRPAGEAAANDALDPIRHDLSRYVLTGPLPVFAGPALILAGRQDEAVGWRDALATCGDWPRATVAILDMAGHEFPLAFQQPLLDALVADFLLRLDMAPGPFGAP